MDRLGPVEYHQIVCAGDENLVDLGVRKTDMQRIFYDERREYSEFSPGLFKVWSKWSLNALEMLQSALHFAALSVCSKAILTQTQRYALILNRP